MFRNHWLCFERSAANVVKVHSIEFSSLVNADANHVNASSLGTATVEHVNSQFRGPFSHHGTHYHISVNMHSLSASDLTDYLTMHMSSVSGADVRREELWPERGLKSHAACTQCRMNSTCRSLQQHANMFTQQVLLFSQPYHLHHK